MDILPFSQKIKAEMEGQRFENPVDPQKVLKKSPGNDVPKWIPRHLSEWIKGMKSALLLMGDIY